MNLGYFIIKMHIFYKWKDRVLWQTFDLWSILTKVGKRGSLMRGLAVQGFFSSLYEPRIEFELFFKVSN